MRIKNITPAFLIIALLCCSLKCRKDKEKPPATLPPITQEGKNTFGCKIDGEIWVPYAECGFGSNLCEELAVDVYRTDSDNALPISFSISAGINKNNSLNSFLIETKTNQGISSVGNKIDSITFSYLKPIGQIYYNYNYYHKLEKFEITKLDLNKKIISGIFDLTIYKSVTDSIKIREGRFDLRFQACQCSN